MLILPDRNIPRSRVLLPVKDREWRTPSQAQKKNSLGHENQTRFRIRALTHDGVVRWIGFFDDRADFDEFLFSLLTGSIGHERELWDLPASTWMPQYGWGNVGWRPDLGEGLLYDFVTTIFITSGTTWTVPGDCVGLRGLSGEFIDCVGAAGAGGVTLGATANAGGSAGGAFARKTSTITLTSGASININVSVNGAATVNTTASTRVTGNASVGETWWNATSLANASANGPTISCAADRGRGGPTAASTGTFLGAVGGDAAVSTGDLKFSGGAGGGIIAGLTSGASGGGACAGFDGSPTATTAVSASNTAGNGRVGDASLDGASSNGVTGSTATSGNGGNGTKYDATHGFGGSTGGNTSITAGARASGTGGSYGAGSGGVSASTVSATSGAGGPGLIVVSYQPAERAVFTRWHHGEFAVDPVSYN